MADRFAPRCERYSKLSQTEASPELIDEFDRLLADAPDERPLQKLFANAPQLIRSLAPAGRATWYLDRPRLGAELIPDFLLATDTSTGMTWAMIELESPTGTPLTRRGLPSKTLAGALKQVRDWRTWLRDNVSYARSELGLRDIDAECRAYVVLGRRSSLRSEQTRLYRALSDTNTTVMTYDRLRDGFLTSAALEE